MTRKISLLLILIASIFATSLANADAYIRGASAPWDRSTNEAAMDAAFGAGNWDDLRMADGAGPFAPGAHTFIFLEGGDDTAIELSNFLAANKTAIENFVNGGGALLLNSAPNQGSNIDFGFGGVTLTYPSFTGTVTAVDATHPIFIGPFTPVVTDYTGGWFGHSIVGGGVTPLIIGAPGDDSAGETVLGEMAFGSGLVMFGGMTTDNYHSPQPEAANLLANIVTYTAAGGGGFVAAPALPIPSLSSWSLVILAALMLLVGFRFRRRLS